MSSHASPRPSKEQRRPLRSESFDSIDDLETVQNGRNGHYKRSSRPGNDWYRTRRTWWNGNGWLRPRTIGITIGVLVALLVLAAAWHKTPGKGQEAESPANPEKPADEKLPTSSTSPKNASSLTPWEKPTEFKIIGLIFFGRPPVIEILDCYLKRNLVSNGGFLDEVYWAENTENEEDLAYLHKLVNREPLYKSISLVEKSYDSAWAQAVDDKNLFIKIDDDMVSCAFSGWVYMTMLIC